MNLESARKLGVYCFIALVAILFLFLFASPVWELVADSKQNSAATKSTFELTYYDIFQMKSLELISALWFVAVGATIGSFANVVVYRLPRGRELVFAGSACPHCGVRIRARDNLPILGWILLGGRCRNCRSEISTRYPIVESLIAILFLVLFVRELISGGANLPVREPNMYSGVVWILFYTKWDLLSYYLFHSIACAVLVTWGLIAWDLQRVPRNYGIGVVLVAVAVHTISPQFALISGWGEEHSFGTSGQSSLDHVYSAMTSVIGILFAILLGLVRWNRIEKSDRSQAVGVTWNRFAMAALAGAVWGWQFLAFVSVATSLVTLLISLVWRKGIYQVGGMVFTAFIFIQLVFWRESYQLLGDAYPKLGIDLASSAAIWGAGLAVLALILEWISVQKVPSEDKTISTGLDSEVAAE